MERSSSWLRWPILAMACLLMIANYYCYDIPAALHQQLNDYMGKPSNFESYFSLLYTLYSIPNIVLPFFGGYFVDKWGVRATLFVFSAFLCCGQVLFSFGLTLKSWPIMFIGRVIYGFGGESLGVANSAVLSLWFQGKELAFAFGLNLSVARLGSVLNNLISPLLTSTVGIQFALWFGSILTGASILCVFVISSIDAQYDKKSNTAVDAKVGFDHNDEFTDEGNMRQPLLEIDAPTSNDQKALSEAHSSTETGQEDEANDRPVWTINTFGQAFWLLAISCVVVYGCVLPFNNIASSLLLERNYFQAPEAGCHLLYPTQCQNNTNVPVDCPLYYSSPTNQPPLPTTIPSSEIDCTQAVYSSGCTEIYCDRLEDAEAKTGAIMSIPYIISASLSPFLGALVDRIGMRAVIAAIAPAILIIVHSFLGLTHNDPVGPLVGQGLAYSGFAAVLWPSVPLVVDECFVGLAFGIVTSIQNAGLAAFPLIVSTIYNHSNHEYIPNVEYFFVSLATLGFIIGLYLNVYDYYNGSKFNLPGGDSDGSSAKEGDANLAVGERAFRNSRNFSTENKTSPLFTKS